MNLNEFISNEIIESYGKDNPVASYLNKEMIDKWINEWYEVTYRRASPTWLSNQTKKNHNIRETESRILKNGTK